MGTVRKLFGIGLSRTGTTSCHALVEQLGLSAVHLPHSYDQIDAHLFANDTTVSARFEQLDARYPTSKFIYTTRPLDAWVASCLTLVNAPFRQPFHHSLPNDDARRWISEADRLLYGRAYTEMVNISADELHAAYRRHDRRVRDYFAQRPDDLLIVDVTDGERLPVGRIVQFLERNRFIAMPQTNAAVVLPPPVDAAKQNAAMKAQVQLRMAETWLTRGRQGAAEGLFRKAIALNPADPTVYLRLARLLGNRPNPQIVLLRDAIAAVPTDAELHKAFVSALDASGDRCANFATTSTRTVRRRSRQSCSTCTARRPSRNSPTPPASRFWTPAPTSTTSITTTPSRSTAPK